MIRRKDDMHIDFENVRGGNGEIEFRRIARTIDDLYGKGRNFSHMVVQPGQSVGYHQHIGDTEWYYVLSGHGEYNDNGDVQPFGPGDTLLCFDGDWHGLVNNSNEPIEMIVLILYTK